MKPKDDPALPALDDWTAHNQRWLVKELARLRIQVEQRLHLLNGGAGAEAAAGPASPHAAWSNPQPPALQRVAALFALSAFERDVLLLAAGVELDRALRALLPAGPSFSLAMSLLDGAHWDAMSPQAPLRRWQLVQLVPSHAPLLPAHAVLQIDERILHALTGVAATDERLRGLVSWPAEARDADADAAQRVAAALRQGSGPVWLQAAAGAGAALLHDTAVAGARGAGRPALQVSLDELPADAAAADTLACRLDREAALADAALVVMPAPTLLAGAEALHRLGGFLARLRGPLVVTAGAAAPPRVVPGRPPQPVAIHNAQVRRAVSALAPARQQALDAALRQFDIDGARLREVIDGLQGTTDSEWPAQLWQRLREAARGGLDTLALRIDSDTGFDDLVLPNAQREQLREIAAQLAQRDRVYREWGFGGAGARGLGIAALFAGDSGTGKTMAAEAIANAVRLDLYRVDLASTVSKYIGETEKNLKRLFDAAEASGAVLLFDEADALFGKRSEVKDSHDRYANIETAYLLQRIESYRGLAILTTNLKSALDRAFLRRIRFVVQFPFPDAAAREAIWRRQFAPAAPLQGVDFGALARWHLAGGNIRTVALNAAFKAAHAGSAIGPQHLQAAAAAEFAKLERSGGPLGGNP